VREDARSGGERRQHKKLVSWCSELCNLNQQGWAMKVKELVQKLATLDQNSKVVVYWEDVDKQRFFEIDEISLTKGTPRRGEDGRPGFTFDPKGPAAWVFINVNPE
jgi:hypothetical protein